MFELHEKIGEGFLLINSRSFGMVYKAVQITTNKTYAIKIIPIDHHDSSDTLREIETIREFDSVNLVHFYSSYVHDSDLWMVMEYCECGSVADVIKLCDMVFSEDMIAHVCRSILLGLVYLHTRLR